MGFFSKWANAARRKANNSGKRPIQRAAACAIEPLENRQLLSLMIDVRLAAGGKTRLLTANDVGTTIDMEVWAVVTGIDGSANEGFQSTHGKFLSSPGGAALGNLRASLAVDSQPRFSSLGASAGTPLDLDNDGDLDIGAVNQDPVDGYFVARSDGMVYTGGVVNGDQHSWHIADLFFTVSQLGYGTTTINYQYRTGTIGSIWWEDGTSKAQQDPNHPPMILGAPITFTSNVPPAAPAGTIAIAPPTTVGGTTQSVSVTYTSQAMITASSIDGSDIRITGPNGFDVLARKVSITPTFDMPSITAVYEFDAPGGFWDSTDNGQYTISLVAGQVTDPWSQSAVAAPATMEVNLPADLANPTATITAGGVSGPTHIGETSYTFTVQYSDDLGILASTIDGADVHVVGPAGSGFDVAASLVGVTPGGDGTLLTATYQITPPGQHGLWDFNDNGVYTVTVQAGQVTDLVRKPVAETSTSFTVDVPEDLQDPDRTLPDPLPAVAGGTGTYQFTITYTDDLAILGTTIDGQDAHVTGPNGFDQWATVFSKSQAGNKTPINVTYQITAPGGYWDSVDNGVYSINLGVGAVTDTAQKAVPGGQMSLTVNVPPVVLTADGTLVINGTAGRDNISLRAAGANLAAWVNGQSTLVRLVGVNRLLIQAFAGADQVKIGKGVNLRGIIDGGIGNDVLIGGVANETLLGGDGNDKLYGGDGKDQLYGGNGKDSLWGGNGSDVLDGGAGSDKLYGEAGNDVIYARDRTRDLVDGGAGKDSAQVDKRKLDVCSKVERWL